ncbi:MAG TPA: ABC transporter ATP-binding protein [Thermodesulfobacteriota bacterium]|nr:ABC transporter ATP-binding protein [Thermodesulfobacteriota bacterium]
MIEVRSVFFRYHQDWVLQDISFRVEKGEFIGVIGPNGSGKTSLLKILYRLLVPQRGEVFYEENPLQQMDRAEIAKKVAVVPQETHSLFPFHVMEIVLMGRSPYLGHLMFETKKDLEIARKALEWTDTLSFSERPIDELSGGERKRVFIARALAQEPEVILLDEPTATLDIHHQIDFLERILDLNHEKGLTIIMASHDMNLASEFCDRLILLKGGKIDQVGTPREVITKENVERVYGCEVWVDQNPISGMPRITLMRKGFHHDDGAMEKDQSGPK